jgi:multiple sugar transport system substrate-binding protein
MSDVVGLDGAWVSDFAKQGALADLSQLMKDAGYDESQLASQVKIKDSTFMIPVLNFVYPMFTNDDLLAKAGVTAPPTNRTEFTAAAEAVTKTGDAKGWVLPLSLQAPNGIQNDVMSWAWASGGSMLKNGAPDLTNTAVKSATNYVKDLWDKGVIAPGSLTMTEQDKVEEFTNGRVGMMIDSLSHVTSIREKNPNLKFSISAIPAEDGFTGKRGIPYASWGIGVSDTGKHKAEAWKLVQFLMSEKTNSTLSTLAHAFPGNTTSTPDFTGTDPLFKTAFDIYKSGTPVNEFVGLPVAEQLMRDFDEQFQGALTGTQSVDDMLTKAQGAWTAKF